MVNIIILVLTAACLLFGFILGIKRGFSRSLLRMLLVILCAVGAWFARAALTDLVLDLEIQGRTVAETIKEALSSADLPESVMSLLDSLVRILVGVVLFLVSFMALQLVSWMIIFPLLKLFLKRHPKKKHRITGMLLGVVQGAFVAYVICFPLTGLLVQFDKVAQLEMNGEKIINLGVDLKVGEYVESPLGEIYVKAGDKLFKMMTVQENENGSVSLDSATSAVVAAVKVGNEVTSISKALEGATGITADNAAAIADSFKNIDAVKNDLDDDSAKLLNDVLKDTAFSLGGGDITIPDDFDFKEVNFTAAGDAIVEIEKYINPENTEELSEESVSVIVNGLAENEIIVDALGSGELASVKEEDKETFITAIDNSNASDEYKEKIKNLLGLGSVSETPEIPPVETP